ncbi:hypothetical protein GCM10020258_25850 [Sphingomonas yabuuchiae]
MRTATVHRATAETVIDVTVNLDGTGVYQNATGIGFLDHMLDQLSRHSLIDLSVKVQGTCISTGTTRPRTARWRSDRPSPRRWATSVASTAMARRCRRWTKC